ncbi:hypothetical protein BV898_05968 [Hypsibius exemplaris]|uniref:Uncharacterized protein n=1 Tax=Hypsibius exemplaris TaxID=2072580 RepID=A0A1W0WXR6_HYPEX|nr:hypothetical protein BV898_05968 [Hypsibius exemplaris]
MDELAGALKTVLAPVVKVTLGKLVKAVGNTETLKTKFNLGEEEINANVDKLLGNGFAQQLLDIEDLFDKFQLELEKSIKLEIKEHKVLAEFRTLQQRIVETQLRYTKWFADPVDINLQRALRKAYLRNDPEGALHWLHQRLTAEGRGKTLIDDIATICGQDLQQFAGWEQDIYLFVIQACSLSLAYLWINSTSSYYPPALKYAGGWDVADRNSATVTTKVCELSKYAREILAGLEYADLKFKSWFLFTCRDTKHKNCPVTPDGLCSELAVKVCDFVRPLSDVPAFSTFRKLQREFNSTQKIPLATALRADYPHFEWSVVISIYTEPDTYSDLGHAVMWSQSIGMETSPFNWEENISSRISSRGLKYGQLHVRKRIERQLLASAYAVTCTVFWTEKKNVPEGHLMNYFEGNYRKSTLFSHSYDLTANYSQSPVCMVDLAEFQDVTFPVSRCFRQLTLTWPKTLTMQDTSIVPLFQ